MDWEALKKAEKRLKELRYELSDEEYAKAQAMYSSALEKYKDIANKAIRPGEDYKLGKNLQPNSLEEIARIRIDKPENLLSTTAPVISGDEFAAKQAAGAAQRESKMAAKLAENAPMQAAKNAENRAAKEMLRKQAMEAAQEGGNILSKMGKAEARQAALQGVKKFGTKALGALTGPAMGIASMLESGDVSAAVPGMESEPLGIPKGMEGYEIENPQQMIPSISRDLPDMSKMQERELNSRTTQVPEDDKLLARKEMLARLKNN